MKNYVYILIIGLVLSGGFAAYERSHAQKSINVVSMTADEMSSALKNGSIAGFISWEPYPAKAVVDGYGSYLVNSKDVWENHPSCVLAISEDLKDEDMIKALVWVQLKGTRFINEPANREKVLQYGMEFSGQDRATVLAAINNTIYVEYPDINQTKKGIEILSKAEVLKKPIVSMGYNDTDEFLADIYQDKYYNEIRQKLDDNPDWTPPAVNGSLRFGYIEGNIHYLGMYIAQKEGYFERVGLKPGKNVRFTAYRSGRAITEAFDNRDVDAATLGSTVLLRYRVNDNGRVHVINGVNTGGTSLIVGADSGIKSVNDLNGRKIATPGFGTCQDTIMRRMFEGFEIKTV
jgi:NitT/TauT family transport system substrate-binding protein